MKGFDDSFLNKKVRLTHYILDPMNGPGQMCNRQYNKEGNPFVVFCSNFNCEHYHERPTALPHWSEDCHEDLGVLRCPKCKAPVVRPSPD